MQANQIERVINLADLRLLLFEKAIHPAVIVSYKSTPPAGDAQIEYWSPKADWTTTQADIITIAPQDRTTLTTGELLENLRSSDAPLIWKSRYWSTPRDVRFLDRLMALPRLRAIVGQPRDKKRWMISEGFQPPGKNDDPKQVRTLSLPSTRFIDATSSAIDLLLLPSDCRRLPSKEIEVRGKSNKNTRVFRKPHVLLTKGFKRVAFADFSVAFRHAVRGIHGPAKDRELLMFLAAYLRSDLAQYYLFHT